MGSPLLSVVIPSYNHAPYLREAIGSVLDQDVDLELLVGDDASSDDSWAVLQTIDDPRLRIWRNEENLGAHANLELGLTQARGRWLAILNSDDRYACGRLAQCLAMLEAGAHDLVGSDIQLIDDQGAAVAEHWWIDAFARLKAIWQQTADPVAALLGGNVFMTTSNFVFARTLWTKLAPFGSQRYVHDYDFLLRALASGARLGWIEQKLLDYRLHGRNTISEQPLNANLEASALLRRHLPALLALPGPLAPRLAALNEQWARIEGYEVDILRALQHEALVCKDAQWQRLVDDRERWIRERDGWIAERDEIIATQTRALDQQRQQLDAQQAELVQVRNAFANMRRRPWRSALRLSAQSVTQRAQRLGQSWRKLNIGRQRSLRRVPDFAELRRLVDQAAPLPQILSFDIFDTLLARCIEPPEAVVDRVAAFVAAELDVDPARARAEREQVTLALRADALAAGNDHECHYDAIIERWLAVLQPTLAVPRRAELAAAIERLESELESLALRAKPEALEFVRWARGKGMRIIAVSDMYLGHRHVRRFLDECGYAGLIDRIYMSSEHGLGKYSGRLFEHVLAHEDVAPENLLHVGDNFHSDALAPAALGIHGVFLDERSERRRRRLQQTSAQLAGLGGVWPGRMLAEIIADRLQHDPRARRDDFYFQYGLEVLGPIFAIFVLGLIERVRQDGSQRVFFLARDGDLFMRMYEAARAQLGETLPAPCYAYASRRVVACAAVADGLGHDKALVGLFNPKQRGLESILKTYGLDPLDFEHLGQRHGFPSLSERLDDWHDPRLLAFLADEEVQQRIRPHGEEARALLHDYFSALGFFKLERLALVDIGWNATIQRFLETTFGTRDDLTYPEVNGYYLAFMNGIHRGQLRHGSIEGLLLDVRRGEPQERAFADFEELFEQGARALHATTVGYERSASGAAVSPVLKEADAPDRQAELACNPFIESMQAGVMLCFEHFLVAQRLAGFDFAALRPYAHALTERAVVYPTAAEVEGIGRLAHTEDFGHDHLLDLSAPQLGWRDFLRPRRLARKLSWLAWPYAAFARLRTPLAAVLVRATQLHQKRKRSS